MLYLGRGAGLALCSVENDVATGSFFGQGAPGPRALHMSWGSLPAPVWQTPLTSPQRTFAANSSNFAPSSRHPARSRSIQSGIQNPGSCDFAQDDEALVTNARGGVVSGVFLPGGCLSPGSDCLREGGFSPYPTGISVHRSGRASPHGAPDRTQRRCRSACRPRPPAAPQTP